MSSKRVPSRPGLLLLLVSLMVGLTLAPATAGAQEKPFDPVFEVLPADRAAGEASQLQIYFKLAEGMDFPKVVSFRVPAEYEIANSDNVADGDIVGEGLIVIKAGALGTQRLGLCLKNKKPNLSGNWATIEAVILLATTECSGLSLTLGIKRFEDGSYGADANIPREAVGQQLDTPIELTLDFNRISLPNPAANPPAPGGSEVIKNPAQQGTYNWKLDLESYSGVKKQLSVPVEIDPPRKKAGAGGKGSFPWIPVAIGAIAAVALAAAVIYFLRRRRGGYYYGEGEYDEGEWSEEYDYYEYDEYSSDADQAVQDRPFAPVGSDASEPGQGAGADDES